MARRGGPVGVFNGNWRNRANREMLEASIDRRYYIIENNKLNFGDALDNLKASDPDWETWYDDDANIPQVIYWVNSEDIDELCRRILERAVRCQRKNRPATP